MFANNKHITSLPTEKQKELARQGFALPAIDLLPKSTHDQPRYVDDNGYATVFVGEGIYIHNPPDFQNLYAKVMGVGALFNLPTSRVRVTLTGGWLLLPSYAGFNAETTPHTVVELRFQHVIVEVNGQRSKLMMLPTLPHGAWVSVIGVTENERSTW